MIHPTAHIGQNVLIGPDTVVGPHASIDGDGTRITIGARCFIGPGARIGQPGFGYDWVADGYDGTTGSWVEKVHAHGVFIEDDVHIGANTCVDRGSWRDTWIQTGTRIDNLVHVAHNVQIGEHCIVIAQAEISGSVVLEDGAYVAPGALIRERLVVGERALVGLGAVVTKDVPAGKTVAGVPARVIGIAVIPPLPPPGRE